MGNVSSETEQHLKQEVRRFWPRRIELGTGGGGGVGNRPVETLRKLHALLFGVP